MSILKISARIISYGSLVILLAAAVMFLTDIASLNTAKSMMTAATIIWFAAATLWTWKQ